MEFDLFDRPWSAAAEKAALRLLAAGAGDLQLAEELNARGLHPGDRAWTAATVGGWRRARGLPDPLPPKALRALELRTQGAALQDIAEALRVSAEEALRLGNLAARLQAEAA